VNATAVSSPRLLAGSRADRGRHLPSSWSLRVRPCHPRPASVLPPVPPLSGLGTASQGRPSSPVLLPGSARDCLSSILSPRSALIRSCSPPRSVPRPGSDLASISQLARYRQPLDRSPGPPPRSLGLVTTALDWIADRQSASRQSLTGNRPGEARSISPADEIGLVDFCQLF
jgi:hypothetical protein